MTRVSLIPKALTVGVAILVRLCAADVVTPEAAAWDAGDVYAGDEVTHTFRIRNAFGVPYTIDHIGVGCGCLSVDSGQRTFQPGDEIQVKARLSAEGFGLRRRVIHVVPTDEALPILRLTLRANVLDRLSIMPTRLRATFRTADSPGADRAALDVTIQGEAPPPAIARVRAVPPVLDCAMAAVAGERTRYRVVVRARPGLPAGRYVGAILLLGLPDPRTGKRPMLGRVRFDVDLEGGPSIRPPSVSFAILRMSTHPRLERYLSVETSEDEPLLAASTSSDFVALHEVSRSAHRRVLAVSLDAQRLPRGHFITTVEVAYPDRRGAARHVDGEGSGRVVE